MIRTDITAIHRTDLSSAAALRLLPLLLRPARS
jgi:hypothetical protein